MKVSVITPTYNRQSLVARAVQSVLQQSAEDIEVIVVDDGSTDNTRETIETLALDSRFPVRYLWKPNGGCASARNFGLKQSAGDAFLFLDSDDALAPGAISSLTKVLEESGAEFVYSPAIEVRQDGAEFINLPVSAGRPDELAVRHFMNTNVRNGAVLFRVSVLAQVGCLNEALGHNEDSDFLQRVAICCRASYSSTPAVRVFLHDGNKSADRVGLYRALLSSSQSVLDDNPLFRQKLGVLAAERLDELRHHLLQAYILNREFDEAARLLDANGLNPRPAERLAVSLRLQAPLRFATLVRRLWNVIRG